MVKGMSESAEMTQDFSDGQTSVWMEMFAQLVPGDSAVPPPADGAAVFWVNTNGHLMGYDGNGVAESSAVVVASNDWSRYVVHCDYTTKTWSLWHNGDPIFAGFGFADPGLTSFTQLGIRDGDNAASAYVDDISVDLSAPSLVAGDGDGDYMKDNWELQYVADTALLGYGPGWDFEQDGFLDYYEYLAGTVPTNEASLLSFEGIQMTPDGAVLTWQSSSNRAYNLDWTL